MRNLLLIIETYSVVKVVLLLQKDINDNFLPCIQANATGGGGHVQLIQKAMKTLTYKSLCFPEMIKSRNMDDVEEMPTYFYRDDGYKVWEATKK